MTTENADNAEIITSKKRAKNWALHEIKSMLQVAIEMNVNLRPNKIKNKYLLSYFLSFIDQRFV